MLFAFYETIIRRKQNMLPQQLKEASGDKTLKAQPYLELMRIYTESSSQSNELLFLDS